MLRKRLFVAFSLLIVVSMLLSACGTKEKIVKETQVVVQKETQVVQVVATPVPVTRTGAWVDRIIFTEQNSAEAAVTQLKAGDMDVYAYTVADPNVFKTVKEDASLAYSSSVGSYNEMTFNPVGPTFLDGRLNPFSVPAIREAMNLLIDRNYVVQEIFGGLAVPKFFCLNSSFSDYAKYVDVARELEAFYAYNPDKAKEIVTAEMGKLGATLEGGKWAFNGAPVSIMIIIRTEDKRRQIGDYFSNQLETIGFTVDRQYKTRSEASPLWVQSDPAEGKWMVYTGGWITTAISRDDGSNFSFFYTPRDYPIPLFMAYTPTAEFDEVSLKLRNNDFTSMDERRDLFVKALRLSMQDSVRIWVVDQLSFTPQSSALDVAYDLAGAVAGSRLWPYTIRWQGKVGGTVKIAQPGLLVDPWNPIAGSNWIYDMMPIRATSDVGVMPDPYTGLSWPQRIEKADVFVQEGLPVAKTLDWVNLQFVPSIDVPADAWVDWDAVNQKFITAAEAYPAGLTAKTKVVVTYPADLWDTVKWHDGSVLSMGDFIMGMIMTFDPGKEASAIFDAAQKETLDAFMAHFKGVKIVSTNPLVIETYDDLFALDAENMVTSWFPVYTYGTGPWHGIAIGVMAEADGKLAFSADKADELGIEWMSYITGPSLDILKDEVEKAAGGYIPYAATMGQYVTTAEAALRWSNLRKWYAIQGHFWVGNGPFYLDKAFPIEGTLTLARFIDYPDSADKWSRFGTPMLAEVELNGPSQVTIGSDATFKVAVNFEGKPYPAQYLGEVKYLLFDAKGALVTSGTATAAGEGAFTVTLGKDVTSKLEAGSNKLEVAVTSLVVSIPTFASYEFVTAP
jgi:peptide/nickel transport system substrate-binding protein